MFYLDERTSVVEELCAIDFRFISKHTPRVSEDEVPTRRCIQIYASPCLTREARDLFRSEFSSDAAANVGRVPQWTIFRIISREKGQDDKCTRPK